MFIAILWVLALFSLLFCTNYGINSVRFLIGLITPRLDGLKADYLINQDPDEALKLMEANIRHRRRREQDDPEWRWDTAAVSSLVIERTPVVGRRPKALKLKTRIYQPKDRFEGNDRSTLASLTSFPSESLHSRTEEECAICYVELEAGDRVGDLPCGHVFHQECLKQWCRCKNRCPFCQRENIATPVYEDGGDTGTEAGSSETTNEA